MGAFSFGASRAGVDVSAVSGVVEVTSHVQSAREKVRHLEEIVVWLDLLDASPVAAGPTPHAQMLQKDKMFHPHVLPIVAGTAVDFPNADPIFHNAFSNYDGQLFDVSLYPPGTSRTVVFRKAGVARVFCNIHPTMSAIILVLKTPYYVKVNSDGRYRIQNVPAGHYELHFYDEWAPGSHEALKLSVEGGASEVNGPDLHIEEAGYATMPPHKNKYGQDYPRGAGSYGTAGPPK